MLTVGMRPDWVWARVGFLEKIVLDLHFIELVGLYHEIQVERPFCGWRWGSFEQKNGSNMHKEGDREEHSLIGDLSMNIRHQVMMSFSSYSFRSVCGKQAQSMPKGEVN